MAASLLIPKLNITTVTNARSFSLGKPLNLASYNKSKYKYRGPWRHEGDIVTHKTNIYSQHHMKYLPGLNVVASKRGQMLALVPGRVMITTEKTNFNFDYKYISRIPNAEGLKYFDYISVIPEPQHNRFKLLDTV